MGQRAEGRMLVGWWCVAGAAEPVVLTLEDALARSEVATEVVAARARADAAHGLARQADAAWAGSVGLGGSYVRNDTEVVLSFADLLGGLPFPVEAPPDATLQPLDTWTVSGTARVPLFAPTAWAESTAAHRSADAAGFVAEESSSAWRAQVVAAAAAVEAAEGLLAAAERALASASEHERAAEVARATGSATLVDTLVAQTTVAQRESAVVSARRAAERAREGLGAALGLDGPARVTLPEAEPAVGDGVARPVLQAADLDLRAAEARVDAAWWRHAPTLSAFGQASAATDAYVSGRDTAWKVGLEATLPLWDGGFRYGRLDQARADRELARATLSEAQRRVAREVREADATVSSARESLALAERQATVARQAADAAERGFEAGTSSALVARDADTEAFRAEVSAVSARASLRAALAEVERARGAGAR